MIYQKCPFKGQLSLAGYAQSSVPGELNTSLILYMRYKFNHTLVEILPKSQKSQKISKKSQSHSKVFKIA